MSEGKRQLEPGEGRAIHDSEQFHTYLKEVIGNCGVILNEAMEQGFTREEAIVMVGLYYHSLFNINNDFGE